MASIPLPALDIKPPQAPNTMEQLGQLMQMKSMGQAQQLQGLQIQEQKLQLEDQKKWRQAFMDAQGDAEKTLQGAAKLGVSPESVLKFKTSLLDQKQKLATLSKDQLENQKAIIGMADASAQRVLTAAPEDRPAVYANERIQLLNSGQFQPQDLPEQYPGDEFVKLHAFAANSAKKAIAETEEAQSKAQQAQSEATIKGAEATSMQQGGMTQAMADSRYRVLQERLAKKIPLSPDDQAFIKGYEKQKLLVPSTTAQIRVEGYGKIRQFPVYDTQTKQTVYMDSNEINDAKLKEPGRYTVPQYSAEPIIQKKTAETFAPGGKAGEELNAFNTAKLHADLLAQASEALQNGDVKALNSANNALKTQFGEAGVTNYRVIANAYSREVTKALSAGHLTNQEIQDQGATMPANASPAQIVGAVKAYRDLMQSKINIRKQGYEAGQQGKPNFGQAAPAQGATKVYQGQTYIQQADGSWKKQ